jgi:hypothetical protein
MGLDNDPRIYLLYYDINVSSDGFFWIFDTEDDLTADYHSNECEVLYLNCGPDGGVNHDPSSNYMIGIVAHEFQHLIHFAYDQNEDNWVNEGLSEYAMFRYGADDPGWIASFLSDPDVELMPSPMPGTFVHYGACWFFMVYLAGHYGGPDFAYDLVHEQGDAITGIDNVLAARLYSQRFTDVYKDWVVANLIDDPSIASGQYGYPDFDFNSIAYSGTHTFHPLGMLSGDVNLYGADYERFMQYDSIRIHFDGRDSDNFALSLVEIDTVGGKSPSVRSVTPDALQEGYFDVHSSLGYDVAVLIPGAMTPGGAPSFYTYSTELITTPLPLTLFIVHPQHLLSEFDLIWVGGGAAVNLYRSLDPSTLGTPGSLYITGIPAPPPYHITGQTEHLIFYSME